MGGANGAYPQAALTLAPDGNFYGTTPRGGIGNDGTVFKVTTNGTLTTLASFNYQDQGYPKSGLALGPDGNFYGTTCGAGITNSTYPSGMGTGFVCLFRFLSPFSRKARRLMLA